MICMLIRKVFFRLQEKWMYTSRYTQSQAVDHARVSWYLWVIFVISLLSSRFETLKYGQLYSYVVPVYKMYPNICPRQVAIHNTNLNALLIMVKLSKMSNNTNYLHKELYSQCMFLLTINISVVQKHWSQTNWFHSTGFWLKNVYKCFFVHVNCS